jgi:hypothetical protein
MRSDSHTKDGRATYHLVILMPGLQHNANVYDREETGFISITEIETILSYKVSHDSAVCIAIGYGLDERGVGV